MLGRIKVKQSVCMFFRCSRNKTCDITNVVLRPPTVFRLQKPQKYDFFLLLIFVYSLEHNPKISNPMVISKVV